MAKKRLPAPDNRSIAQRAKKYFYPTEREDNAPAVQSTHRGLLMRYPPRTVQVGKDVYDDVHPEELMRIIKNITQTIGEYKNQGNMHASYAIPALRKARSQVVADLEKHFKITWQANSDGKSEFFPLQ